MNTPFLLSAFIVGLDFFLNVIHYPNRFISTWVAGSWIFVGWEPNGSCSRQGKASSGDQKVRWCLKSDLELRKCNNLAAKSALLACVKKDGTKECIGAIKNGEADAITLDGGDIFTAGLVNYNLHPILAEIYSKGV